MAKKDQLDDALEAAVGAATGLVNLKLSKKEKKDLNEVGPASSEGPNYPWGTRLQFEDDIVEKLGLGKLSVGDKVEITGVGEVTEISQRESGKSKSRRVEIQIQRVAVEREK